MIIYEYIIDYWSSFRLGRQSESLKSKRRLYIKEKIKNVMHSKTSVARPIMSLEWKIYVSKVVTWRMWWRCRGVEEGKVLGECKCKGDKGGRRLRSFHPLPLLLPRPKSSVAGGPRAR